MQSVRRQPWMDARVVPFVLMIATTASGCRDAEEQLRLRRSTSNLLRSISDMDMQLATEEDSLKYLTIMGKSDVEQRSVIEFAKRRLAELRNEILKHSKVDNPKVDQIRYEELDHPKLHDRLKRIQEEHSKGMTRAKEWFTSKKPPSEANEFEAPESLPY